MPNKTRLVCSIEGQDCTLYAPQAYLKALYRWFDQLPLGDQEAVPSWFGDMMDTVSDDWDD